MIFKRKVTNFKIRNDYPIEGYWERLIEVSILELALEEWVEFLLEFQEAVPWAKAVS